MKWHGKHSPYAHQSKGVQELLENRRWLLAWEMGTGKSAVIANRLRFAHDNQEFKGPTLIICPKSVVRVWPEQLEEHGGIGRRITVIEGTTAKRNAIYKKIQNFLENRIAIINYDLIVKDEKMLQMLKFDCFVYDEVHRLKNLASKVSRAVRRLMKRGVRYRWGLSGTPFPNNCMDACGILSVLDPTILGTERVGPLRAKYAITNKMHPSWVMGNNPDTAPDLAKKVASVSSRILKKDALDLPEKIFVKRVCTLPKMWREVYDGIKDDAVARLSNLKTEGVLTAANVLTESLRLLQCAGGNLPDDDGNVYSSNPNAKMDLLQDVLTEITSSCIIWTTFKIECIAVATLLEAKKKGYCIHHGGMDTKDRLESIERFKNKEVQFLVSTTASLREGVTLTIADTMIYYSRNWNLLNWLQSQDRAHRIGQKNPVTIFSLIAEDTIDCKVDRALNSKISMQEAILQSSSVEDLI